MNDTERLIGKIYEAVENDELWADVLNELMHATGSVSASFDHRTAASGYMPLLALHNFFDESKSAHFESYSCPLDNPAVAALFSAKPGKAFDMRSFMPKKLYDSDPAAMAILHPQQFEKAVLVGLERTYASVSFMTFFRTPGHEDYDPGNTRLLSMFAAHIIRALQLRDIVHRSRSLEKEAITAVSDALNLTGLLVVSSAGKLVQIDNTAQAIIDMNRGLELVGGCLRVSALCRKLGTWAFNDYVLKAHSSMAPLVIEGAYRSMIIARLLSSQSHGLRTVALELKHVHEEPNITAFAAHFNLTEAEIKVVRSLTKHKNGSDAARALGISRNTIKSHLKSIFAKSDCVSLSQLMLLLGRMS